MADECSSPQNDGGEFSGSKLKSSSSSSVAPSTRLQRNQAEKKRRDRLNSYISELANIVPMVNSADKTLDKVSILRLSAAYLRLNKSCLHPKRFKSKMVSLPSLVLPHLDLIEKSTGGFVIVTTFTGVILYCSNSVHDYLGYQNIDVIGNSIYCYVHKDDSSRFERKMNNVISYQKKGKKRSKVFKAHVQQKPIPRSNDIKFRKMVFKLSVHVNGHAEGGGGSETSGEKKKKICRTKDFGTNAIVLMFVEPIKIEPEPDAIFIDSHQEGYFTMHGLRGEILYADQRITTITGYTSTDVKGKSAYEYIFSSDVPIALFAQKDMFSSQNGTGIITYRLRVKNLRYVYLQSKGQTVYKQDTKTLSHFVCFNKLLR
ncbi:hypoxia-inducible factor 1-alpha-like [Uloborus diversus]|uniref:hypoxia-inducible factor 1-alpha-like n=1 Tax=Uloborus diversus TaxID=327109 RepID=UPI00240A2439|nr:hypoxia-inducible factor 1-alpha-like [Uloborus diversus]